MPNVACGSLRYTYCCGLSLACNEMLALPKKITLVGEETDGLLFAASTHHDGFQEITAY